jgi:Protein of unknown function (DUF3140)
VAQHTERDNLTTVQAFKELLNMSAAELDDWLQTEESQAVGMKSDEAGESVGHQSGRRSVELLHRKERDYTEEDYDQMRRVVSYVRRHLAQKPSSDIEHSRWRYSLKNWGHDPLKDASKK